VEIGKYGSFISRVVRGELGLLPVAVVMPIQSVLLDTKADENAKLSERKHSMLYSPDGSRYAYSDFGVFYVMDKNTGKQKLLVSGNDSQGEDREYCYPFEWADNSWLIYGIGGYEGPRLR
jgi:hypothetical protein